MSVVFTGGRRDHGRSGCIVILFLPEVLPLRSMSAAQQRAQEEADEAADEKADEAALPPLAH